MFRSFAIVAILAAGAGGALAKGPSSASGPCVYDSNRFCGAPAMLGANKKPVRCLMDHMDSLMKECQAKLQEAMSPKP